MARTFTIASGETVDLPASDQQRTNLYFADAQSVDDFSFEQAQVHGQVTITAGGATVTLPFSSYAGGYYKVYAGSPGEQPISLGSLRLRSGNSNVDNSGTFLGSANSDIHIGRSVADTVSVSSGDDIVYGKGGDDNIIGGSGHDILYGDAGVDYLGGGDGNDRLYGGADGDIIDGGDDNDEIYGGAGVDTLDGGAGNDIFYGSLGADAIDGGSGIDTLNYETLPWRCNHRLLKPEPSLFRRIR